LVKRVWYEFSNYKIRNKIIFSFYVCLFWLDEKI
jgi:hypothetical protein